MRFFRKYVIDDRLPVGRVFFVLARHVEAYDGSGGVPALGVERRHRVVQTVTREVVFDDSRDAHFSKLGYRLARDEGVLYVVYEPFEELALQSVRRSGASHHETELDTRVLGALFAAKARARS